MSDVPPLVPFNDPVIVPTREGYDRWAEIYDAEDNPLIALEEARLGDLLGDVAGLDVLDAGCGTGRQTLRLVEAGARVTALDFSDRMLERAKAKPGWERVRLIHQDLARPLALADASFDKIVCCLVLDHIAELAGVFREFARVCRPNGRIILSSVHPALALRGVQAHFTDPATAQDVFPASVSNSLSDYVMAAVGAGLAIEHMSEHAVDEPLAARCPRARKYLGWPMLLLIRLRRAAP